MKIDNPFRSYFKSHDCTQGIFEFEDGKISTIEPMDIKFIGNELDQYMWDYVVEILKCYPDVLVGIDN